MTDFQAQVTFFVEDDKIPVLMAKAKEIDQEYNGVDEDLDYSVAQAVQIVWHIEPKWLHGEVLHGWTLDRVCDDDDHGWHDVWPERSA